MGLLVVIPAMLAHWVYYLSSWTSPTHLLYLYLLLRSWACWLSFLPRWPIEFIILLLPLILFFAPVFLIVGLLLLLGFFSIKNGHQQPAFVVATIWFSRKF